MTAPRRSAADQRDRRRALLFVVADLTDLGASSVVVLDGRSPDAVAVLDGELVAVKLVGLRKDRDWRLTGGRTIRGWLARYKPPFKRAMVYRYERGKPDEVVYVVRG